MKYFIMIAAIDSTDTIERLEFEDSEAWCYATPEYLSINTIPTGFGDWNAERCVPWHRVLDFRKVPA